MALIFIFSFIFILTDDEQSLAGIGLLESIITQLFLIVGHTEQHE